MENMIKPEDNPWIQRSCYLADNNYAFKYDRFRVAQNDENKRSYEQDTKIMNFVPIYDKWCLNCEEKDVEHRCSKCKSVFFCSEKCQKKAWPIHKKHCGRDLFKICSMCGEDGPNLKCDTCPVKFCSDKCKKQIWINHKEFDCDYFAEIFG